MDTSKYAIRPLSAHFIAFDQTVTWHQTEIEPVVELPMVLDWLKARPLARVQMEPLEALRYGLSVVEAAHRALAIAAERAERDAAAD